MRTMHVPLQTRLGGVALADPPVRPTNGFTTGTSENVKARAEAVLEDASSILMYQAALKSNLAQKFLKVLVTLRSSTDPIKIREILFGSDNPFALTATKGEQPSAALWAAASSDLDALQDEEESTGVGSEAGGLPEQRSTYRPKA
eukprot:gene7042-8398_t